MNDSPDKLENLGKLEAEIPALTLRNPWFSATIARIMRGTPAQGIPVLEIGSGYTDMKKNEIKPVRAKATEGMTKEQLEDRAFAQMLLWVATAVVVEVIMLLLNRFYVHARVSELGFKVPMYKVLTAFPIVGTILFVVFLVAAVKVHRSDSLHDGTLQAAVACGFLCTGFGGLLLRNMETAIAPMVLVVVPALGVLMMVYYLYQREFFASVLVGALGLLGLWMFRSFGTGTMYYGCLILALVVALVGVVLAGKAKAKDGVLTLGGQDYQLFQPETAYLAFFLTVVITAVLLLAPLALGTAMAYYGIWAMAAWLFILAVYFTSKLM